MKKNGSTFISILSSDELLSGVWNPHNYQYLDADLVPLSNYVKIEKVNGKKKDIRFFDYSPIEYKHILKGDFVNFFIENKSNNLTGKFSFVGAETLIFGTMRAYLGNVCITPLGNWVGKSEDVEYAVNSEFVKIQPLDDLKYFWWAYIKSCSFLNELPTGNGGTRPRVSPDLLGNIHVNVPDKSKRQDINGKLKHLAKSSWGNYMKNKNILKELQSYYA